MNNDGKGYRIFCVFNVIFMIILSFMMLYPMLYVIFASLSNSSELMKHTGILLSPLDTTFNAYKMVFRNPMILSGYKNTIFVVVAGVALNMIMTSLTAYVLSRKKLPLKKQMTLFIVFTMYFSGGLLPTYLTVKQIGLDNSIWSIIIPGAISAYNMIIMRTSMEMLPDALTESASIEGANHFTILFKIVLPLSKSVIAVLILYYAVSHWNSWFNAMLYLRDRGKFPLQLILREILISNDTELMTGSTSLKDTNSIAESVQYAVIVVATLPILAIYPFLQKYFEKGVMIGAVKE